MIIQNFKLALRGLLKNKLGAGINILGLMVGMTVSLLIFSYVRKEKSTDQFIPDVENIYILTNKDYPSLSKKQADLIKEKMPEIENITFGGAEWSQQVFFSNNNNNYKIKNLMVADSCFFRVFQFEPVWGDPASALNATNKVVITRSLAKKIFGNENPVGKTLGYNTTYFQNELLEVSAVINDLPQNSSWHFEAVLSIQTNYKLGWYVRNLQNWGSQNYQVFCRVNNHLSKTVLNTKLAALPLDAVPETYKDHIAFGVFPFNKVYFDYPILDIVKHGNRYTLSIIQIIGILILLLACVNYINMVTAQREIRHKKIGIILTQGAGKRKIVEMLTAESGLVLTIAIILTLFLSWALLGSLNGTTDSRFTFQYLVSGWNLLILSVMFLFTLIVTGIIPGYFFSKQKASVLLKKQSAGTKGNLMRNGLLVFQFTISILLISGILLMNKQNRYLNSTDPGFQKENIIYAGTSPNIQDNIQAFKNELKKIPAITDITFSTEPIGNIKENWAMMLYNKGEEKEIEFAKFTVTPNFFDFFGISLKQGRPFNENSSRNTEIIFNETSMRNFNIEKISDARLVVGSKKGAIVGVSEDFNFESLHVPIRAAGFLCSGESDEVIYLKMNTENYTAFHDAMNSVENVWNKISPNFPMEINYLDASWESLYIKDRQFQKILSYATIISIILSCLGLIGLTFFVMEQRTKEIGVRKVNGATISEILIMLNNDFIKWIAMAFVIACPITWYAMNKWLENFAYKTNLSWWIFALAGLLVLGIALLTVSWQSWRAATRNPVEALRYE